MREIYCFVFERDGDEQMRPLFESIKRALIEDICSTYTYALYADSKECKYALDYAEKHAVPYRLIKKMEFTKRDVKEARYFYLYMTSDVLELEGTDTKDYGTAYKGGCELCGLGAEPSSDVLVDRNFMKNKKIGELPPEYFVSKEVRGLIEENEFTGVRFRHRIIDFKGRDMDEFFTLDVENVLPRVSSRTQTSTYSGDARFKGCGHGTLYLDSDLYYDKESLDNAKDFNVTYEYFNNRRMRQIVVSARVKEAMSKKRLYVHFTPILINGENYES